ncbi:MAG: AAA family ATPase [Bacteroidales bacterium]|nr:AAA family ATPase [Bacteroidales bacterium]
MRITHIYAENYKTYRRLDLDLSADEERPIILIGGGNGCGKTTLFDAIYHALYGLNIKSSRQFEELLNAGVKLEQGMDNKSIVLEISFSGLVLGHETPYKLKRTYQLIEGKVRWNVELNMNGNRYSYGIATPTAQRTQNEEVVNKIIAANLPSELSNYFLFDAMKTSELVKEEQISKLIMKNINSVMGFNKYYQLHEAADALLAEKKAAKLENEKQRQEYEQLGHKKQGREAELKQLREDYEKALEYSNDNRERYEQLKQGRNADDMTRDRINKQKESIRQVEKRAAEYHDSVDKVAKDLELNVLFPALAHRIRPEVEIIVSERRRLAEERGEEISDEQLTRLAHDIVEYLAQSYSELKSVKVDDVVRYMQKGRKHGDVLTDKHPFLSDANVEVLDKLITDAYVNQFLQLDNEREVLDMDVSELPRKLEQLENYERDLSGLDFNLIALYEDNEKRMIELKGKIAEAERDIQKLADDIATFDYDIPQIPDPQYDMLCKLPKFFNDISAKLLASKRKNIEQMMKEQLNLNLVVYAGVIGRVDLSSDGNDDVSFKIYHQNGNEIYLSQLNAGAKQTVMQVLLKVLYELGDYNPPVMIDTVMGVLDKESREVILEHYFPDLAHQTILLSTDTEITTDRDFKKIEAYVAKTYTLHRDKEAQCTTITNDYFGITIND